MRIHGSRSLVCAALPLLAAACASGHRTALIEAMQEYNDGIRWQRLEEASSYVTAAQRNAFAARLEQLQDVRVTDYQVTAVKVSGDSKAYALVRIDWYSVRNLQLHQTVVQQTWDRKGDRWEVADQRWVRGKSFPLFAAAAGPAAMTAQAASPAGGVQQRPGGEAR